MLRGRQGLSLIALTRFRQGFNVMKTHGSLSIRVDLANHRKGNGWYEHCAKD